MKSFGIKLALFFALVDPTQVIVASSLTKSGTERISFNTGQIEAFENLGNIQTYELEYQGKPFKIYGFDIIPSLGYSHSEDGTNYTYLSARHDFRISDSWVATPVFGLGYFDDGRKIKLGHEVEFMSGVEFAYEFSNENRLGLKLVHLSNAGLSSTNPGTEILSITFSLPIQ